MLKRWRRRRLLNNRKVAVVIIVVAVVSGLCGWFLRAVTMTEAEATQQLPVLITHVSTNQDPVNITRMSWLTNGSHRRILYIAVEIHRPAPQLWLVDIFIHINDENLGHLPLEDRVLNERGLASVTYAIQLERALTLNERVNVALVFGNYEPLVWRGTVS